MRVLHASAEFEVFVITDMPENQARQMLANNGVTDFSHLLCADWASHEDLCKSVLMREHQIDIHIDDRPDYIAEGCPIGLCVMPRPSAPYYSKDWIR